MDDNADAAARALPRWILQISGRDAATHPASGILISDFVDQTVVLPVLSLLLSFGLSLTVAIVYKYLSRGVPQVKNVSADARCIGIVSAIIVLSVGDNIARGIGLVGALTVIRFRNNLQDPRDLIFAFAALATGVAAGALRFCRGALRDDAVPGGDSSGFATLVHENANVQCHPVVSDGWERRRIRSRSRES